METPSSLWVILVYISNGILCIVYTPWLCKHDWYPCSVQVEKHIPSTCSTASSLEFVLDIWTQEEVYWSVAHWWKTGLAYTRPWSLPHKLHTHTAEVSLSATEKGKKNKEGKGVRKGRKEWTGGRRELLCVHPCVESVPSLHHPEVQCFRMRPAYLSTSDTLPWAQSARGFSLNTGTMKLGLFGLWELEAGAFQWSPPLSTQVLGTAKLKTEKYTPNPWLARISMQYKLKYSKVFLKTGCLYLTTKTR